MSKFTSLTTAAALLSTLALPAMATTPRHHAVKHPVHRVAATSTDVVTKPVPMTAAPTAPAPVAAKPVTVIPGATPAPVTAKPGPARTN